MTDNDTERDSPVTWLETHGGAPAPFGTPVESEGEL